MYAKFEHLKLCMFGSLSKFEPKFIYFKKLELCLKHCNENS